MTKTNLKGKGGETKMEQHEREFPLDDADLPIKVNLVEELAVPTIGYSPSQAVGILNSEVPGLGMTGRKLRKLIRKGQIKAVKDGGRWVISLETCTGLLETAKSQMAAKKATAAAVEDEAE